MQAYEQLYMQVWKQIYQTYKHLNQYVKARSMIGSCSFLLGGGNVDPKRLS